MIAFRNKLIENGCYLIRVIRTSGLFGDLVNNNLEAAGQD